MNRAAEKPDVGDRDREGGKPEREGPAELPQHQLQTRNGCEEQRLERAALALAADRVRGGEERQQRADGDRDLRREIDGLALLEEAEGGVRRGEVGEQKGETEQETAS